MEYVPSLSYNIQRNALPDAFSNYQNARMLCFTENVSLMQERMKVWKLIS